MKKILIASLAFATIFTSCVKEQENGPFDGTNTVTFELPIKNAVTYATTGTTDENSIGGGVAVYMFNGGTFEQAFNPGDAGYSLNGNKLTVNVNGSGTRDFYIIANINNVTFPGSLTLTGLKNLVSDAPAQVGGKYHAINPAANAGDYILMSAPATGINVTTPTSTTVKLVRRMARFDVVKDGATLNVSNVLISNANVSGDVFAGASGNTYTKGSIESIALTFTANKVEGAFYLYPTELGDGKTVISFQTDKGIYVVKTPKAIEANKLYTITVKETDSDEPEFILDTEDWDDVGNDLNAEPESSVGGIVDTPVVGANASFTNNVLTVVSAKGTTLEVVTSLSTATPVVTVSPAGAVTVTSGTAVMTYAGAYYAQTHTITVAEGATEIDATVKIQSGSTTIEIAVIRKNANGPVYGNTGLHSVKIGGLYWAPVNVGATTLDATELNQASCGFLFQWGRNQGWEYPGPAETDLMEGPISLADANGQFISKFVYMPNGVIDETYNGYWLRPEDRTANKLWEENVQGPCPQGWRLPTFDEASALIAATTVSYDVATENMVTLISADGILKIPFARIRQRADGLIYSQKIAQFFTSTPSVGNGDIKWQFNCKAFQFGETFKGVMDITRSNGYSVRCVQDIQ